jgi:signal transduction histidine kinase
MKTLLIHTQDSGSYRELRQILTRLGHEITETSDYNFKETGKEPETDLVILDGSGDLDAVMRTAYQVRTQIELPVIFTGRFPEKIFFTRESFGFIPEPFETEQIRQEIARTLNVFSKETKLRSYREKYMQELRIRNFLSQFIPRFQERETELKIREMMDELRTFFDLAGIAIYLVHPAKNQFYRYAESLADKGAPILPAPDVFNRCSAENLETLKKKDHVFYADLNTPAEVKSSMDVSGVRALLSIPLVMKSNFLGFLFLAHAGQKPFGKSSRNTASMIGYCFSSFIFNQQEEKKLLLLENEKQLQEEWLEKAERMATLGSLTSGIVHEINKPLQSIKILTGGILYRHKNGEKIPYDKILGNMGKISRRCDRIKDIIENVKGLYHSVRQTDVHGIDLNENILSILHFMEPDIREQRINVLLDLAPKVKPVNFTRIQFQQILVNLLNNAMEALKRIDGERLIHIRTREQEEKALVEISDNGPGIPETIEKNVFDPFFTTGQGMGIGLYLVRKILSAFEADIEIVSNYPEGALFRISIQHELRRREGE